MELKDFLSRALVELVQGIREAQDKVADLGALVSPEMMAGTSTIQEVEFDLEVTTSEGEATKGGLGIFVGALGVGAQGKTESRSGSVGRMRFKVPVSYPKQKRPQRPG
jgi:hypothetical protein